MNTGYFIGIDQGTTNIKAGLFTLQGELLCEASHQFTVSRPAPGVAEQDPDKWWEALLSILRELFSRHRVKVSGLAFCSQVNSHIFADESGKALLPVMLWQDLRPLKYCDELNARIALEPDLYPAGLKIDETALAARAEWLKREMPDIWKKTAYIFSPKDYLNMRLTGIAAADALASIGMVNQEATEYLPYLDHLVPGLGSRLPQLVPFRSRLGVMKKTGDALLDSCLDETIVAEGTMDVFGNLYGSGAVEAGDAIEVTGTCEIVGSLSESSTPGTGICYFPKLDGLYFHSAPTKSGGASQMWLCSLLGIELAEFVALAETVKPGSDGLIFLPYLEGERGPIWDGAATGVFFGLTGAHTKAHLCRAVIEGVAFSARHLAEEVDKASGFAARRYRISGGSTKSDLCCQIRADVLGRPVDRIQVANSGMLGAVLISTVAAGASSSLAEGARKLVHIAKTYTPNPENTAMYDRMYEVYKVLYPQLKGCYQKALHFR